MIQDLYLLHGETVLELKATIDVNSFNIIHSIPLNYEEQVPIFFEVTENTSPEVLNYSISNDTHQPNKNVIFTISPLKKNKIIKIHLNYCVLVKNKKYRDIPRFVKIPQYSKLPEEAKIWLLPTEAVQSKNILIRIRSFFFRLFNKNLIKLVKKVVFYITFHRIILQFIRFKLETNSLLRPIFLPKKYYTGLMDAVSSLIFGSLCAGQINLAAALLRANGIPTRILIVTMFGMVLFQGEKIWFDSHHYMIEFYCPGYGWIKCTPGKFAHQPKNYIIFRVIYPEDENKAGNGLSYYGGLIPWFWINNDNISLVFPEKLIKVYKKPRGNVSGVPAIRFWTEKKIFFDKNIAEKLFNNAKKIWESFISINPIKLDNNRFKLYKISINLQKNAIKYLNNSDIKNYLKCLDKCNKIIKKIKNI